MLVRKINFGQREKGKHKMNEKIFDAIWKNLRNPKFYTFLLVLVVVFLILFPYIDANIFYYKRVNNRVDILSKLSEIDVDRIKDSDILMEEYHRILAEVDKQSDGSIGSVIIRDSSRDILRIKFITGGLVFWILAVICAFIKKFGNVGYKIAAIILLCGIGWLSGQLAKIIPTIITPLVNYIGFPLLLIVLFALLSTSSNSAKG